MNCQEIINKKVEQLGKYLKENNLRSMVLGVSGGIDSLLVAYLCNKVFENTKIKLITVSLPTKTNEVDEVDRAKRAGKLFGTQFIEQSINGVFNTVKGNLCNYGKGNRMNPVRQSNIKARLRMIYLMDIAQDNWGTVIGTDNATEHILGFYTIFGDQGMIEPIVDLWKTDIYKIARYIVSQYTEQFNKEDDVDKRNKLQEYIDLFTETIDAVPTDGNGANPDLVQIGCHSYSRLDSILQGKANDVTEEEQERIFSRVNKNKFKQHIPITFTDASSC